MIEGQQESSMRNELDKIGNNGTRSSVADALKTTGTKRDTEGCQAKLRTVYELLSEDPTLRDVDITEVVKERHGDSVGSAFYREMREHMGFKTKETQVEKFFRINNIASRSRKLLTVGVVTKSPNVNDLDVVKAWAEKLSRSSGAGTIELRLSNGGFVEFAVR